MLPLVERLKQPTLLNQHRSCQHSYKGHVDVRSSLASSLHSAKHWCEPAVQVLSLQ